MTALSVPLVAGTTDPVQLAGQFEGDIELTEADRQAVTNGAVPGRRTWPGAVIRYVIASGFSETERGVIAAAFRELERRTCVGVHPVPPGAPSGDFVHIVRGRGCSSAVGRLGGNQTLSLSEGCFTRGVVLHQLLHAAGLWHEQSRPDRYQYISVLADNVAAGRLLDLRAYARVPSPPTPVYQRRSLMHLSRWAFSADDSRPTLQSTEDASEPLGQRDGLTTEDALAVNLLYGCERGAAPPLPTPPDVDGDCADRNEHCDWWARRGECSRNPGYMNEFCAKACRQCTGESFSAAWLVNPSKSKDKNCMMCSTSLGHKLGTRNLMFQCMTYAIAVKRTFPFICTHVGKLVSAQTQCVMLIRRRLSAAGGLHAYCRHLAACGGHRDSTQPLRGVTVTCVMPLSGHTKECYLSHMHVSFDVTGLPSRH